MESFIYFAHFEDDRHTRVINDINPPCSLIRVGKNPRLARLASASLGPIMLSLAGSLAAFHAPSVFVSLIVQLTSLHS